MNLLDRSVLQSFVDDIDDSTFEKAYDNIAGVLEDAIMEIKRRNPYISNYSLLVANEVFTESQFCASSLDVFVVFDAIQIELNTQKNAKKKFVQTLKTYWQEFLNSFKLFGSKKKKRQKEIKRIEKKALSLSTYDVKMLYEDLVAQLSKLLYVNTSISIKNNNKISICGDEEFGIEINVIPVFKIGDEEKYKLYNIKNNKEFIIDFRKRFENIELKNEATLEGYATQIKIFNNLYWNVIGKKPNQIFIESLLCGCPNDLFLINDVETTINLVNYLKNNAMQNIKSICDKSVPLFNEPLNTTSFGTALKFVSNIDIKD